MVDFSQVSTPLPELGLSFDLNLPVALWKGNHSTHNSFPRYVTLSYHCLSPFFLSFIVVLRVYSSLSKSSINYFTQNDKEWLMECVLSKAVVLRIWILMLPRNPLWGVVGITPRASLPVLLCNNLALYIHNEVDHSILYSHLQQGCKYLIVYVNEKVITGSNHIWIGQLMPYLLH